MEVLVRLHNPNKPEEFYVPGTRNGAQQSYTVHKNGALGLVSYRTPVAIIVGKVAYKLDYRISTTTTRQVREWLVAMTNGAYEIKEVNGDGMRRLWRQHIINPIYFPYRPEEVI